MKWWVLETPLSVLLHLSSLNFPPQAQKEKKRPNNKDQKTSDVSGGGLHFGKLERAEMLATLPPLIGFHFMRSGRPPFFSKLWCWETWHTTSYVPSSKGEILAQEAHTAYWAS